MKKTTIVLFFSIFMSAVIFVNSLYTNEVFVNGSNINIQKYVKFCKANTKIKDLKESPEEGWNVMLMRSIDSDGKIIGLAPHMAVIYVNADTSISVTHYTKGKTWHSEGWSQNELEKKGKMIDGVWHAKFNYTSEKDDMKAFGYYPIGELK